MDLYTITRNALIGQALGDAFGVPVEFLSRQEVRSMDLQEMTGSDSERVPDSRWGEMIPAGSWSDDTSMTVASMTSFIRNKGKIDYTDQMTQFARWWEEGEYCCLSYPFGLGGNVSASLQRFRNGIPALECGGRGIMDNGNGALMRILPFSLYCIFNHLNNEETVDVTGKGSGITHGHEISRMCCFIWTEFLRALTEKQDINAAIDHIEEIPYSRWFSEETSRKIEFITNRKTRGLTDRDIRETGYVVDTLYSALFSLYYAKDFRTSIQKAVNLGYDTDTAGAVTGTAAGIMYGLDRVPKQWMAALKKQEALDMIAKDFAACFTAL